MRVQWTTASEVDRRLRLAFPAGRPSAVVATAIDGLPVYVTATTPHYDGDCTRPEPHACAERSIRVWSQTGQPLLTVDGVGDEQLVVMDVDGGPAAVTFEPNDDRAPDELADLLVVDLRSGTIARRLTGHAGRALTITAASANSVVSMGLDGYLRVFDLDKGETRAYEPGERLRAVSVLRPDGAPVAVAAGVGLTVWDLDTGALLAQFPEAAAVHQLATWAGDERHVVAVSFDGTVRVWDITAGEPVGAVLDLGRYAYQAACLITPDGRPLIAASDSEAIRLWDPFAGEYAGPPLIGPTAWSAPAAGPPGTVLTASATDDRVAVWELSNDPGPPRRGHPTMIYCLGLSLDGRVVAGGRDGSVAAYHLDDGRLSAPLGRITAPARAITALRIDDQTVVLAAGGDLNADPDNEVYRWIDGSPAPSLTAEHNGNVELLVPGEIDGDPVVFTAGCGNTAYMLDVRTGELLGAFEGRSPVIGIASGTVDDHVAVAVSYYTNGLLLGDLDAGAAIKPAGEALEVGEAVRALVTISDEPAVVTERTGEIRLRFVHTGQCVTVQPERSAHISALAVRGGATPLAAVARTDATVSVVDLTSRTTVDTIRLAYPSHALVWTADGDLVIACRRDLLRVGF